MKVEKNSLSNKLALPIGILGLFSGIFYFIYSNFINVEKTDLRFTVLTNTSIVEIKDNLNKLKIIYDSINVLENDKDISFTIIEFRNAGKKSLINSDYDMSLPFGLRIVNGDLINKPEIINSSDKKYFSDIIDKSDNNNIFLKKKIIDPEEFIQIKFYTIHDKKNKPILEFFGKISNQKVIPIIDTVKEAKIDYEREATLTKITTILSIALITILSLLTLSLYKNNNIRLKTNNLLHKKYEDLLDKIGELEKK